VRSAKLSPARRDCGTTVAARRFNGATARRPTSSIEFNMPLYFIDTPADIPLVVSTEHAGIAAHRAGRPREDNPHLDPCELIAVDLTDDRSRRELTNAWFRGWDREHAQAMRPDALEPRAIEADAHASAR
jgi:hypothetical protein